jgi:hypothetical protein
LNTFLGGPLEWAPLERVVEEGAPLERVVEEGALWSRSELRQ